MATIYCDECHFEWNAQETEIQTIVLNETDDVRMRFFQCPECGDEYIVDVTDREIRKKISIYNKMRKKYLKMYNDKESATRLRNYGQRLQNVSIEIQQDEKVLKGRWTRA